MKILLRNLLSCAAAIAALSPVSLVAQNFVSPPGIGRNLERLTLLPAPASVANSRQNVERLTLLPGPASAPANAPVTFSAQAESLVRTGAVPQFHFVPSASPEGHRRQPMIKKSEGTLTLRLAQGNDPESFAPPLNAIRPTPDLLRFDSTLQTPMTPALRRTPAAPLH